MSAMNEAIKRYILGRKKNKETIILNSKFEKDGDGGLIKIIIKEIKATGACPLHELEAISKKTKTKEEDALVFSTEKYCQIIDLARKHHVDLSPYTTSYTELKQKIADEHNFIFWLNHNCKHAERACAATHVAKLTHSSSKASCYFDEIKAVNKRYVTTSMLKKPVIDGAYDDAKYSPMAELLLVESDGRYFYEDIIEGNFDALNEFGANQDQITFWSDQLIKAIDKPNKKSCSLSKQIYFPLMGNKAFEDKDYMFALPLISSSLTQAVFDKTVEKSFKDKNYSLKRKYKTKGIYSNETLEEMPRLAVLMSTQSSHQSVSIQNSKRNGRLPVLSCQPPVWQRQAKPPIAQKSWFAYGVPFSAIKDDVQYLRDYLLRFERLGLSTKAPDKQTWLVKWASRIVNTVFDYATVVQDLTPGWSDATTIQLKTEHQYFLDPYRADEHFQSAKNASDWGTVIARDFAQWLNKQLRGKDKAFTPQAEHSKLWQALMLEELRLHKQMVKAVLQTNKGGEA